MPTRSLHHLLFLVLFSSLLAACGSEESGGDCRRASESCAEGFTCMQSVHGFWSCEADDGRDASSVTDASASSGGPGFDTSRVPDSTSFDASSGFDTDGPGFDTFEPDTFVFDTFEPDTFVFDTFEPDTSEPDTSEPDVSSAMDACVNSSDLNYLSATVTSNGSTLSGEEAAQRAAGDCGLASITEPPDSQREAVIDCMQGDPYFIGLSYECTGCYGDIVLCTIQNCLSSCAADPSSAACVACQNNEPGSSNSGGVNCVQEFDNCSGL